MQCLGHDYGIILKSILFGVLFTDKNVLKHPTTSSGIVQTSILRNGKNLKWTAVKEKVTFKSKYKFGKKIIAFNHKQTLQFIALE